MNVNMLHINFQPKQLWIADEKLKCLIHGLELRRGFFLSFFPSDTPHYGNVPFEIPSSWVWCKLENITVLIEDCPHTTAKDEGEGYPLVRTPNIGEGQLLLDGVHRVSKEVYDKRNIRAVPQVNDIIYAREAPAGNAAVIRENEQVCLGQRTVLIRPMDTLIDSVWLTYAILAPYSRNHLTSKATGSTVSHVNMASIRPFDLPLPPISEQHRIVAEIRRWFALIDQIEQGKSDLQATIKQTKNKILDLAIHGKLVPQDPNDEPAIELLKRINLDFTPCDNGHYTQLPDGWCYATIKEVFIINPKNKADDDVEVGFVPMANITDGYNNTFKYETKQWGKIKTGFTHFANGDIAVAKISPCLENRKSVVLKGLPNGIGVGTTELHVFRPLFLDVQYGLYFFKSDYFISQCVGSFNGVVGQQRVSKNIIENMIIAIPPINEQKRIACAVHKIFAKLDMIMESL